MSPSTVSIAWRRYQEKGHYMRRAGQDCRRETRYNRTGICSFVKRGTGVLPEPYKMSSSRPLVCMFLTKLSETDSMRVA